MDRTQKRGKANSDRILHTFWSFPNLQKVCPRRCSFCGDFWSYVYVLSPFKQTEVILYPCLKLHYILLFVKLTIWTRKHLFLFVLKISIKKNANYKFRRFICITGRHEKNILVPMTGTNIFPNETKNLKL